jgi:hypothetical protein
VAPPSTLCGWSVHQSPADYGLEDS